MRRHVDLNADRVCPQLCEGQAGRLQLVTPCRLQAAGKELFAQAQAAGEIENHRKIGTRVRQRRLCAAGPSPPRPERIP